MAHNTFIALLLFQLFTLSGCYAGYHLTSAEKDSGSIQNHSRTSDTDSFPVYLASATNEPEDEGETSLTYGLSKALQATGLYSAVHIVPPQGNFIEAKLAVHSSTDEDEQLANIAKMALTGASFFLLSAALPQTNHFDADYTLDVNWPSRAQRRYRAHCSAYSYATIDKYRDVQRSAKDLRQTACINSLVNQMSKDYPRMMEGRVYVGPKGMTTGELTQWGRNKDPNQAKPEAVCTEVGLIPGTKSYGDCLSELK